MKLSTLNESVDITGKLDPLINKYEKLRDSTIDEQEELHFKLTIDKLKSINDLDDLKKYLHGIYEALTKESKELKKAITPASTNTFRKEFYDKRVKIFNRSISSYNDIISYCKSMKLF